MHPISQKTTPTISAPMHMFMKTIMIPSSTPTQNPT
jgi:hypothetical protein